MKIIFSFLLIFFSMLASGQRPVIRDIRSFGAKGDGRTNDHAAFQKTATFFNDRGGNVKLIISKGTYILGKQTFNTNTTSKPVYEDSDALGLKNVKDLTIEGQAGAMLKYAKGLRFGALEPGTGRPYLHGNNYFVNYAYLGSICSAISIDNRKNIMVKNIVMDGNNGELVIGGLYGDVGLQVPHMGIFVANSTSVTVDKVYVHHFGLDGIQVTNKTGYEKESDRIILQDSRFEYNDPQGLSWVGGNDLAAICCSFINTSQRQNFIFTG